MISMLSKFLLNILKSTVMDFVLNFCDSFINSFKYTDSSISVIVLDMVYCIRYDDAWKY